MTELNHNSNLKHSAQRALWRQLEYQRQKAKEIISHQEFYEDLQHHKQSVFQKIQTLAPDQNITGHVLEVGSGAHGLIFSWGAETGIGIDPLADHYRELFPYWQNRAQTLPAFGEKLPFQDLSFDLVLSDNVVDHAENPEQIISEIYRVLKPSGLFYFTVHIHHPIYSWIAKILNFAERLGLTIQIGPFLDHTFHFSHKEAKKLVRSPNQNWIILSELIDWKGAKPIPKNHEPRFFIRMFKSLFFKNATYEAILQKNELKSL